MQGWRGAGQVQVRYMALTMVVPSSHFTYHIPQAAEPGPSHGESCCAQLLV